MDYSNYKIIQAMKKSEKAEVLFAAVDGLDAPVVVKRLSEANPEIYRVISEIGNVHIPRIFDIREQDNKLLIVEEYIDGKTLDVYLSEVRLGDIQKLELMVQLCEALEALHGCNPPVIHRDIKPTNILINEEGILKIIDFDASRQYKGNKNTSDTRLLGTIEYAAPEQFGYAQTDFRSDIYSAGVVFSELKMEEKGVFFKDWKRLVDKCTSFDPENRYKDVAELKKDLQKCIRVAKQPGRKKWLVPLVAGAVLFVMVLAGGLQLHREKERGTVVPEQTVLVTQEKKPTGVEENSEPTAEPDPTKEPEETAESEPTKEPEETAEPEPTKEPEMTEMPGNNESEGSILAEDRFEWNEAMLPVTVCVRESATYGIKKVYVCEQAEAEDPYSEAITPVDAGVYEVSKDGRTLWLGNVFWEEYGNRSERVLFLEFDDGSGERVWLTYTE